MEIQIRRPGRQLHGLHPRSLQRLQELRREQWISVVDQVLLPGEHSIDTIGEVSRDLVHPEAIDDRGDAGNLHLAGRKVDEEEHEEALEAARGPDFHSEEVRRDDQVPMARKELLPGGLSSALRRGFEAVPCEDRGDGGAGELVAEVREGSLDAAIAPIAVLAG